MSLWAGHVLFFWLIQTELFLCLCECFSKLGADQSDKEGHGYVSQHLQWRISGKELVEEEITNELALKLAIWECDSQQSHSSCYRNTVLVQVFLLTKFKLSSVLTSGINLFHLLIVCLPRPPPTQGLGGNWNCFLRASVDGWPVSSIGWWAVESVDPSTVCMQTFQHSNKMAFCTFPWGKPALGAVLSLVDYKYYYSKAWLTNPLSIHLWAKSWKQFDLDNENVFKSLLSKLGCKI